MNAIRTEDEERFKGLIKVHLKLKEDGKSSEGHLLGAIAKHIFNIDVSKTANLYEEAQREYIQKQGADAHKINQN